jgi:hypothetical protein
MKAIGTTDRRIGDPADDRRKVFGGLSCFLAMGATFFMPECYRAF